MTRNEFAKMIRNKDATDITPQDCRLYLDLFDKMDRSQVEKFLDIDGIMKLGKACRIYRERAYYQFFELGRNNVEVFKGMYLYRHPESPLEKKYREMIPDDMPQKECMKLVDKFTSQILAKSQNL